MSLSNPGRTGVVVRSLIRAGVFLLALGAPVARADSDDAIFRDLFATWDDNARVTRSAVRVNYAQKIEYYGHVLTPEQVYAEKRAFVRRWPERRYTVVPGSVRKRFFDQNRQCSVDLVLAWQTTSRIRAAAAHGTTTVHLDLVRENGVLKIAGESGHRL